MTMYPDVSESLHFRLVLVGALITTGDVLFAEGFWVCRGLDLGHSTKGVFAEGQPQEPSAKLGPRQTNGPRQNKSLPRA